MKELSWYDMNSLNAIAGYLRYTNPHMAANILQIQEKASLMLAEREAKETEIMNYVKTANVTNTKNVLVQIPAWVVKHWGLQQGDKLEVCYNATDEEICIRRSIYTDVQGGSNATQESN